MAIHGEDKRLIKRLLAGDERAFAQFFDEYFNRLYRFVLTRVPDDEDSVTEIVQSALTRALRNIHTYRGESALFTWLCVICRNEVSDWYRRNAGHRRHLVLIEDRPDIQAAIDALNAPVQDHPAESYVRTEAARLIHVALDNIPAKYGNALEWKYIEGRSVREIAGRLGISTEAAQSVLARAKHAFRDVYATLAGSLVTPVTREQTG